MPMAAFTLAATGALQVLAIAPEFMLPNVKE
jgi:hypothetical protein